MAAISQFVRKQGSNEYRPACLRPRLALQQQIHANYLQTGQRSAPPNAMQLLWLLQPPYAHKIIKNKKKRKQNTHSTSPRFLSTWTSESSLLSNIIYGLWEINIKNRKGKTTARTIKKLVVKVRGTRGGIGYVAPRAGGPNPSAPALRRARPPAPYAKGLGRLTLSTALCNNSAIRVLCSRTSVYVNLEVV